MKTGKDGNSVTERAGRGRWIGVTLAIVAFVGLSYGAFRLWHKSDQTETAPAVQLLAGESVTIPVEGMSCSSCVARVKRTLKAMDGVREVHVSLEKREAEIRYQPEKTSPEILAKAIDELGYKAGIPKSKEKVQ